MASIWSKRSGTKLGTLDEGENHTVNLPIDSGIPIEVISGTLPPGMILDGNTVKGIPDEVSRLTTFRFVLRATVDNEVYDRTYEIDIAGADQPEWITPEDLLPVGKNENFFILDSSPVDYQLEAIDSDTAAGEELEYFIASNDGELPPGITLTADGRLVGVVDPILALEKEAGNGNFDTGRFDRYPYDFAIKKLGGLESFFYPGETQEERQEYALENNVGYDSRPYDLSSATQTPKKLNRYFEFIVSVSDGDTVAKRKFRIFVVGDDFLRADNAIMQVGTGIFTADNTYLRTPIWLTPSNLGVRRANNFITLFLDTLDPNNIAGVIAYDLLPNNDDGSKSQLPPGTEFDRNTGEVFGRVPYQPAVSREYKFTVNARRIESGTDTVELQQFAIEFTSENSTQIKINKLGNLSSSAKGRTFSIDNSIYIVESINDFDPDFDLITISDPLEQDINEGTTINLGRVSVASSEIAESQKTFKVTLIGEIDSTIEWLTDANLGTIPSNYISILKVQAQTTVPNSFLLYTLEEGSLPPGLSLSFSGEIIGSVDNEEVEADTTYSFKIKTRDQFGLSAIERTFSLKVENKDDTLYSNIYYKPLLPQTERSEYLNFVTNSEIFLPNTIYRPQDPNFGVQKEIKILVYAGIETRQVEQYVAAAAKHASRKTLKIRDIKKAVAKEPGTNNEIYEVIYLDVYDPYEKSGEVAKKLTTESGSTITVDSIRTTPDNPLYDTERLSSLTVSKRFDKASKIYFENQIPVNTRQSIAAWKVENTPALVNRNAERDAFDFNQGSSTNIFYRPKNENTIRADSNAVRVSDPENRFLYVNNITNVRDRLRELGKTERDFLPLWMRTAQAGTLQELGYTLAVPLAYCKPGTGDQILSAIRVSDFDVRQFKLEVDRFLIDKTEGESQEQYIIFADYEFNLA